MKRELIYLVEVVARDGRFEEWFEVKEEAESYLQRALLFTSNASLSTWSYERPKVIA